MIKRKSLFKKVVFIFLLVFISLISLISFKLYRDVKSVLIWKDNVDEVAQKYDIAEYSDVILAIIYTESKGKHVDLMQSSEVKYGKTNQIATSEESIETGVEHLSEVIKESNTNGCDIWTAVQAYNYGTQYIDYISKNGKVNSLELAEKYSRDILSPLLGNESQKTYRYNYPIALLYNGGKLYENGGNMFYAPTVRINMKIISFFK